MQFQVLHRLAGVDGHTSDALIGEPPAQVADFWGLTTLDPSHAW
jgi:hypothetical protein